jgi:hypothetical protein
MVAVSRCGLPGRLSGLRSPGAGRCPDPRVDPAASRAATGALTRVLTVWCGRSVGGLAGRAVIGVIPVIWVAGGGCTGHTGTRCRQFTGDMFGVTNSTCDDSLQRACDRNAALGKVSIWDKASAEHRRMKNRPVAFPGRAVSARLALASAVRGRRSGYAWHRRLAGPGGRSRARPGRPVRRPDRGALNWSLRRYVPASSLRVWLTRRIAGPAGAPGPVRAPWAVIAVDGCPRRGGGRLPVVSAGARPPASGTRPGGVWPHGRRSCRCSQRNGQMEYFTLVKAGLRGGVRRGAAIASRECRGAQDQVLTTLGSKTCVQSNIFGFVTT